MIEFFVNTMLMITKTEIAAYFAGIALVTISIYTVIRLMHIFGKG